MKLRNKIFITFTCLVLILLATVGIAVHRTFKSSSNEEVVKKTENSMIQLGYNLDLMMEDASRSTLSILYNSELLQILREYDSDSTTLYKKAGHIKTFSLFLSSITFKKDQVYGIHVFTENGQVFSNLGEYLLKDSIPLEEQDWFQKVKDEKGGWITYFDKSPTYYKNENREFVSFIRLLRDPNDHEELGVIRIDFSPSYLKDITAQFTNENWQILTADNEPLIGNLNATDLVNCQTNYSWVQDDKSGGRSICLTNTSQKTGMKVVNLISEDYLYKEVREFDRFLLLLLGICILISLPISYYMANYLLKPFDILKNKILLFQSKNQSAMDPLDEISELGVAYDGMLSEIEFLVEKVYETNQRNAEAEFKALQSQMDPHFLFNTLESINMKAIQHDQYEISDMIVELGKLLRFRLRNEEQQIPLQEELMFTKTYINIMKSRLEDTLEVYWDVDETILDYPVPKYIIQPLLENAIHHGYGDHVKVLTISITIKSYQHSLIISVNDNGVGIRSERLLTIKKALHEKSANLDNVEGQTQSSNSIALVNINSRLQLMYGSTSRLEITSIFGKGTTVYIEIDR
ncbi:sensor histidine kinase [Ferdinandcohnia sp. Marseille-Q9671]